MSIYKLLNETLSISQETRNALDTIDTKLKEHFFFEDAIIITKIASRLIEEVNLQYNSAQAAKIEVLGFDHLFTNLARIDPTCPVTFRSIGSNGWSGLAYYSKENESLGIMIAKKRRPNWKTPPNWDGSEKQLVEYNNHLHDLDRPDSKP